MIKKHLPAVRAVFVFGALSLGVASSADAPAATIFPVASVENQTADTLNCKKSTVSARKFAEIFHAIAMHGDLTDIPFIEKTLQGKMTARYQIEEGKPNPDRIFYSASMMDSAYGVGLDIVLGHDQQIKRGWIAIMRFGDSDHRSLRDCLGMSSREIGDLFAGTPLITPSTDGTPFMSSTTQIGGKNETKIQISFSYGTDDMIVDGASIQQFP